MMTPDEHIQEVLARGTGWWRLGQRLVLDERAGRHVIARSNDPAPDVWIRGYTTGHAPTWADTWFYNAMDAADEVEELVRVRGFNTAERAVRS